MKCDDYLAIIEEYFDGELGGRDSAKVADHLLDCATCNKVFEALQQEQKLYVHYRRDVEVSAALWQGVQAAIRQEAKGKETLTQASLAKRVRRFFTEAFQAPRFSPALAAMLVVIAIGATVVVMKYVNSNSIAPTVAAGNANRSAPSMIPNSNEALPATPGSEIGVAPAPPQETIKKDQGVRQTPGNEKVYAPKQPRSQVAKATESEPGVTAEDLLRDAEMKYIKAIALLERDFDKRRSKLDPKLVAKLDGSLASIDRTIAETRKAVRHNPGDPIALQYMLTAYAKKVEVLKDVTAN